VKHKQSDR